MLLPTPVPAWRRALRLVAVPAVVVGLTVSAAPAALADGDSRGSEVSRSAARGVPAARLAFEARIIKTARNNSGIRYRYGGTSPRTGFDCSGYVGYVYRLNGRSLPRTASSIYHAVRRIPRSQARPGDLVFFYHRGGHVYHVGIYAGGGMIYHASRPGRPSGKGKIYSSRVSFGRV